MSHLPIRVRLTLAFAAAAFIAAMQMPSFRIASPTALEEGNADAVGGTEESPAFEGTFGYENPETERLFHGPGLCLHSLACGVTGGDPAAFSVHDLPKEWFGNVPHTHYTYATVTNADGTTSTVVTTASYQRSAAARG